MSVQVPEAVCEGMSVCANEKRACECAGMCEEEDTGQASVRESKRLTSSVAKLHTDARDTSRRDLIKAVLKKAPLERQLKLVCSLCPRIMGTTVPG